jgi:hypothetical protein
METETKTEKNMEKKSSNKKNATYRTGTVSDGWQTALGENFSIRCLHLRLHLFLETEIFSPRHFVVTYFIQYFSAGWWLELGKKISISISKKSWLTTPTREYYEFHNTWPKLCLKGLQARRKCRLAVPAPYVPVPVEIYDNAFMHHHEQHQHMPMALTPVSHHCDPTEEIQAPSLETADSCDMWQPGICSQEGILAYH